MSEELSPSGSEGWLRMKFPSLVPKMILVNRKKDKPMMPGLLLVELDEAMN